MSSTHYETPSVPHALLRQQFVPEHSTRAPFVPTRAVFVALDLMRRSGLLAFSVRVAALRWVAGAWFLSLGLSFLLLPQGSLGPLLGLAWLRGALSVCSALCLLWVAGAAPPRRMALALHVLAVVPQLFFAFEFLRLGAIPSGAMLSLLAVAILLAPFARSSTSVPPRTDLLGLVLGAAQAILGLDMLSNPASASVLVRFGINPMVVGALMLLAGFSIVVVQLAPRATRRWAHGFAGALMFGLWLGQALLDPAYFVLGTALLIRALATTMLPWFSDSLTRFDRSSLRVRFALALFSVSLVPPLVVLPIVLDTLDPTGTESLGVRQLAYGVTLFGALVFAAVGWWLAGQLIAPLTTLVRGVKRIADGERGVSLVGAAPTELVGLSTAVEQMANALDARVREREALLAREQAARAVAERSARLQAITAHLSAALTPAQVANVILREAVAALNASVVSIKCLSDDGQWLESVDDLGYTPELLAAYRRYPVSTPTPIAEAVRSGAPVWLESRKALLECYPQSAQLMTALDFHASCALPLTQGERIVGAIGASFTRPQSFDADERTFLLTVARQCAQALERAWLYQAEQQARGELAQRVAERTRELQQANIELRRLAAHLQSSREDERANIARELHDELGQVLTVIKMVVAQLLRHMSADPDLKKLSRAQAIEELQAISQNIDDSIRAIRALVANLRPQILDDLGLKAAIEWQAQQFQERTGIKTQFTSNVDTVNLEYARALALFRIVQESLTNVARHAGATHVDVALHMDANDLRLEVRDNGRGIARDELSKQGHFGVLGMRERALVLGGDIQIGAAPGGGTVVVVQVPR